MSIKALIIIVLLAGIAMNWEAITGPSGAHDFSNSDKEVVLYATAWCGYCEKTRRLFSENQIRYIEHDIEKSPSAHREFKRLGGKGVPLVRIERELIFGYVPEQIIAAMNEGI